ncbi:biliverdin-producing heme oxygenase [Thiohalophilus sp.]|uniref:biliverdin-producing heme oxygenase n=1 Tax=Thiohalophilus sp. TaxID=3028392 RepID=UPI002ACE5F9B|nr:biliverdin-producing heme oxygenase [Thiohalophilus sp.]MDZ7662422.1 biliverdin-producing heme oxygenase [Thiohalophilus sp.]
MGHDTIRNSGSTRSVTQPGATGLLGRLRAATRPAHQALEQHPILRPLPGPALTGEDYLRVLNAFADFYRVLEPSLLNEFTRLADKQDTVYRYQQRWPLLRDDLRDLHTMTSIIPPEIPNLPSIYDTSRLLGVLYVLEGATQGGRIIAPHLAKTLGLKATCGARYFHLYKQGMWQHFKVLLACYDGVLDDIAATHSAVQVFDVLYQHFDHYLPPDRTEP